jgi:GxxExxY protein
MDENQIGKIVVDAAIRVHRGLGHGLLESVYEIVLSHELSQRGLSVARQVPIAITYRDQRFDEGFRADIVVEGRVILELKSTKAMNDAHKKQLLTYLRLAGMKLGYLLNFSSPLMRDGIVRTVNLLAESK